MIIGLKLVANAEKLSISLIDQKTILEPFGDIALFLTQLYECDEKNSLLLIETLIELMHLNFPIIKNKSQHLFDTISNLSLNSSINVRICSLLFCQEYFENMTGLVRKAFSSTKNNSIKELVAKIFAIGSENCNIQNYVLNISFFEFISSVSMIQIMYHIPIYCYLLVLIPSFLLLIFVVLFLFFY